MFPSCVCDVVDPLRDVTTVTGTFPDNDDVTRDCDVNCCDDDA